MRRLGRTLRQRQPSQAKTIAQKVAAILRKYGTDAHVYLPGIGVINGLTAGNYLDSAGTTAATVDNPVGLVLDGANSQLGSELITNGDFSVDANWTKGTGWTISGGFAAFSNATATTLTQSLATTPKTYRVQFDLVIVSGSVTPSFGGGGSNPGSTYNTSGTKIEYITTTANRTVFGFSPTSGANITSIDNISVKEVTGIHALQATTADKMILRRTAGRYWWDAVDATDKLTMTFPAGYESSTTIDAAPTGQATLTAQNIVGTYAITTDTYGRFVFKTITADELAIVQTYCNRLAGV